MKTKFGNKYKLIFFAAGCIIFIYLIASYGVASIIENIIKTGFWFIPVILVWFVIYLLNTYTWLVVLKPSNSKINFRTLLSIHMSSSAVNYLTPVVSLGGEPLRILSVSEYVGNDIAMSSSLLYNIFHVFSHLIFWSICCLISLVIFRGKSISFFILIILVVLSALIFIFLLGFKNGFLAFFVKILKGKLLPKRLRNVLESKKLKIQIVDDAIMSFYSNNRKYFYMAVLSELLGRVTTSFEIYFILLSLDIVVSPLQTIYIYGAMSLFLNLMFFVPMETGTREAGLYYIVGSLGIPNQIGIFVSIVCRLREFFWILVGLILLKMGKFGRNSSVKISN